MLKFPLFLFLLTFSLNSFAKLSVTFATGALANIKDEYEYNVLKLALDHSIEQYGEYELNIRPGNDVPSYTRLRVETENNRYENMVYKDSVSNELMDKLLGIPFPVDLGAASYRVGFVSPESSQKIKHIKTKNQLTSLTMIQGRGWLDGEILESQGFKVVEGRYIEGLFHMAANMRGDLFPLGAHELKTAWEQFKHIEYLDYDKSICIYYPLPKFFFTHKDNVEFAERVKTGLENAYQSGDLFKLWKKYFYDKVMFSNLSQRKIFKFENPKISAVDKSYEQYILDPSTL